MSLIIYTNKEDEAWIKELSKYAEGNSWSISKAVRELVKAYFAVANAVFNEDFNEGFKETTAAAINLLKKHMLDEEPKIDLATFEAQQVSKLIVNQDLEACIKEKTVNGEISCYFFDNAREYHPYCKSECWTNSNIWGKRVRL